MVAAFLAKSHVIFTSFLLASLCHFQNHWNIDIEWKHGKHNTAFCVRKGNETFEKRAQELNSSCEEYIDHRFWTEKRMGI